MQECVVHEGVQRVDRFVHGLAVQIDRRGCLRIARRLVVLDLGRFVPAGGPLRLRRFHLRLVHDGAPAFQLNDEAPPAADLDHDAASQAPDVDAVAGGESHDLELRAVDDEPVLDVTRAVRSYAALIRRG